MRFPTDVCAEKHRYPALTFEVIRKCSTTKARVSNAFLPHGIVNLPVFMPVGTKATIKGVEERQIEELNCQIMLNNTYHLALRPGQEILDKIKGAHNLQACSRNLLTDSGGFQMVSLLELSSVSEEGVKFLSPKDQKTMLLTPEKSIEMQNSIGSDIMMQLDDVVPSLTAGPRVEEAMWRSVRWLDRCIAANRFPNEQNLFCIIQGGLDKNLRKECCKEMIKRNTPGIAIGGLSGGEEKGETFNIVKFCTDMLPENKPRYLMGVGYAEDMIISVALGIDMFDCVYPTRTARFGNALTKKGVMNLKKKCYVDDFGPIEQDCDCSVCSKDKMGLTRSYLCRNIKTEAAGIRLVSIHNVYFQLNLMNLIREAILNDRYPQFIKDFFFNWYKGDKSKYPDWAIDSLRAVNVDLLD